MRVDGSFAGANEIGEVVVRGHNVMKGYLNCPDANRRIFEHGWLHTGDLGYIDEDSFIYLTGRKKDIIIRSGLNVYPAEVEDVLLECPGVAEAAVAGEPDRVRGEELIAFVVPDPGHEPNEKEIRTFCRQELAGYQCPRRFNFVEALPRRADGAVDKEALAAEKS
jgi:long-chain acyl-CoA synthetase